MQHLISDCQIVPNIFSGHSALQLCINLEGRQSNTNWSNMQNVHPHNFAVQQPSNFVSDPKKRKVKGKIPPLSGITIQ